ncbi:ArsR family transcriptional regulator [Candidatus Woesearchaeota archaeon]|nr:ArsR family transcriptional regulator [Candidatus Woesearchaeota archaeon]
MQHITFVRVPYPEKNIHLQLQWLGCSLGLLGERDKDRSCFRIFIELLKAAQHKMALTSDELAVRTKLSRGTVVHHLNKLIDAGMVNTVHNTYSLRAETLTQLIEELRRDAGKIADTLAKGAAELDASLGL